MKKIKNEKIFIIILSILAIAGISFFIYETQKNLKYEPDLSQLSKDEAISLARDFLVNNGLITDGDLKTYDAAVSYSSDNRRYPFLTKIFDNDKEKINKYLKENDFPLIQYAVRFFKEEEKKEFLIALDPEKKSISNFGQQISEEEERNELTKEEARELAIAFIKDKGFDTAMLSDKDYSSETHPNRLDHLFIFRVEGSEIESEYGQAYKEISIAVFGDKVGAYDYTLFVPEKFKRDIQKQKSLGVFLTILSFLASILMIVFALVVLIKQFIKKNVDYKLFLYISLIGFGLLFLDGINGFEMIKFGYQTEMSKLIFYGIGFSVIAISAIIMSCVFLFVGGASGHALTKEIWPEKEKILTKFKFSKEFSHSIFRGYLIASLLLGLMSLIYFIGEKYFSVWSLPDLYSYNFLLAFVPTFSILVTVLFAAFSEEFLYRLFGITLFKKYTKSVFLAIIITTIIWGIAHSNYPVFPVYFRAIELFIGGSILGYFFVRYNITTVIAAHYIFNATIFFVLFITSKDSFLISQALFIILIPLLLALIPYIKKSSPVALTPH